VLLLRGDTQQDKALNQTDGEERRAFAALDRVTEELRAALPPNASVATFVTAGSAPLCEQVQWVHGASLVLSPHGAHLTNALWMASGALLLEAMPWGMWDYPRTYTGLLKGSGVLHQRLLARRPPPDAPHYANLTTGEQEHDQGRCGRNEACRRFYRAHSALHLSPGRVCVATRRRFQPAAARRIDCSRFGTS